MRLFFAAALVCTAAAQRLPDSLRLAVMESKPGSFDRLADAAGHLTTMADPFDPRWEAELRLYVRAHTQKPGVNGWLVRHPTLDLHRFVYSKSCAAALRRFLESRYGGSFDSLNKAWNDERYSSFEEVVEQKPDPLIRTGAMYEDYMAFSREMVRRANQTLIRIVREEDPGRAILAAVGTHSDYFDLYSDFDMIVVNPDARLMEMAHARTAKPVVIQACPPVRAAYGNLPFVVSAYCPD